MPWKGVTMNEQRQRFLEDYKLNVYTTTDLADRFGISRRTAHKWIDRFEKSGLSGYHELYRRPPSPCPPRLPQARPSRTQRHLGRRLQGPVPPRQWFLLLPPHRLRPGFPLSPRRRRPPGDLLGEDPAPLHQALPGVRPSSSHPH